ncbi:peroxidase-like, partial [Trichoplusia ni]|uniref:Peroxidase-like n=1 Tax=Trichoplusia ni TaxID=7111 RepID=A0A7E5WII8_TRINI
FFFPFFFTLYNKFVYVAFKCFSFSYRICTVNIKPCDPEEWKRLDGSCNNLEYPSVGTHRTPTTRLLPPILNPNYEPADTVSGAPFPVARRIRCELLSEGKASDLTTTQLLSYFLLSATHDINSLDDFYNYIIHILHCCEPEGQNDYMCTPQRIPVDDPVHRYSGVSCMNLTRPMSYQTHGCLENGTTFVRVRSNLLTSFHSRREKANKNPELVHLHIVYPFLGIM